MWVLRVMYFPLRFFLTIMLFSSNKHASRLPLNYFLTESKILQNLQKQHNCIPDEHYVQTLLEVSSMSIEYLFRQFYVIETLQYFMKLAYVLCGKYSYANLCFYLF